MTEFLAFANCARSSSCGRSDATAAMIPKIQETNARMLSPKSTRAMRSFFSRGRGDLGGFAGLSLGAGAGSMEAPGSWPFDPEPFLTRARPPASGWEPSERVVRLRLSCISVAPRARPRARRRLEGRSYTQELPGERAGATPLRERMSLALAPPSAAHLEAARRT